ncbi:MAG: hypothetical protein ACI86C_000302 [Candidatus Latescibacterota bacterium]|jgi:hypothetical protein
MNKEGIQFIVGLIAITALLCGAHYYIFLNFFVDLKLYFPIWSIYTFNAGLVLVVFLIIYYKVSNGSESVMNIFLGLTSVKMLLAIVFLLPLFFGKSENMKVDAFNFFIPYFAYLAFEIVSISKFLKKQETK